MLLNGCQLLFSYYNPKQWLVSIVYRSFLILLFFTSGTAFAQRIYVVNSTEDLEDIDLADSLCNDKNGNCTLRAAIQNANKNNKKDKVHFNIKGSGPFRISLKKNLPDIIEPIILDASTQPGYTISSPQIVLCGKDISPFPPIDRKYRIKGLSLTGRSSGSLIKGFVIGGFGKKNYLVDGKTMPWVMGGGIIISSNNNYIHGNYIGIAADGLTRVSNFFGIAVINKASKNFIGGLRPEERNIISGNYRAGILISNNTEVVGNYIGTSADGNCKVGNEDGISIVYFGENNILRENVISGNSRGINLMGENNHILKNRIGTDFKGRGSIPNEVGVFIESGSDNLIGDNLISGNRIGIKQEEVYSVRPQYNRIFGNLVGTDISGTYAIPNNIGVAFYNGSFNEIGGTRVKNRNLISGNLQAGLWFSDSGNNTISGNFIGTDLTGLNPLPNTVGIQFAVGKDSVINSSNHILQNVVSGNRSDGIILKYASYTTLAQNYIGIAGDSISPLPNGGSGIILGEVSTGNCIGGHNRNGANIIGYNGDHGIFSNHSGQPKGELPNNKLLHNIFIDNCNADVSSGFGLVKEK